MFFSAPNQYISMISDGSWYTEYWSIDDENVALQVVYS